MNRIITYDELKAVTGYSTASALARCLKRQGVPVLYGKNGPFTTLAAIENSLGIGVESKAPGEKYNFDFDDATTAEEKR